MTLRRRQIRIALIAVACWIATLGIYIERDVQSLPCSSDDNTDLADIPSSDRGLYLNAYVETPEFTKFGMPGLLHYTGASAPYSLVVVGFVPIDSGFQKITIASVSVLNESHASAVHTVDSSDVLDEFKTAHGTVRCANIPCGRFIDGGSSATLVVKGTLHSDDGDRRFERKLKMPINRTTYIYPGWAFVFLPMYA